MKKNITIEEALDLFEQYALRHGYWSYEDVVHYKTANYYYDQIIKVVNYLKEQGALVSLTPFYDHPSPYVREWAAAFLLPVDEKRSLKVIKAIEKSGIPHLSFNARMLRQEWENGHLKNFYTLSPIDLKSSK